MHRRFGRLAARILLACLPVAGLTAGTIGAPALAAPAPVPASVPASTRAAALAALKHLLLGVHGTDHAAGWRLSAARAPGQSTSENWSGYADTGSTFSRASGSWTQPAAKCGKATALAVFWAGIDGFVSQTVEQDGSLAFCSGGKPSYYTWWEMFPADNIQLAGLTVKPGDHIAASVAATGTAYTLKVTDSTTPGNSFSETESCAAATCVDSSAEWIAEAPESNGKFVPLASFGTWTLRNAAVTGGGTSGTISTFADDAITMVDSGGKVKAEPGPLSATGSQFEVTWKSST
jgi:hypothetical protein